MNVNVSKNGFRSLMVLPSINNQRITSMALNGKETLYIGTEIGELYSYNFISMRPLENNIYIKCLQVNKVGSKKIKDIQLIPELGLIVLCNGALSVLDLDLKQTHFIDIPSRARNFALRRSYTQSFKYNEHRVAVSVGKMLHICDLSPKKSTKKIFALPAEPKKLIWIEDNIFIAYEKEYSMINNITGKCTELLSLRDPVNPNFYYFPTEEILLSTANMGWLKSPSLNSQARTLRWRKIPLCFAFCFPYILSASYDSLEVQNLFYGNKVYEPIFMRDCKIMLNMGRYVLMATDTTVSCLILDTEKFIHEQEFEEKIKMIEEGKSQPLRDYLFSLLADQSNPCHSLVETFSSLFRIKFENVLISEVNLVIDDIKVIRDHTNEGINKIIHTIYSIFPEILACKNLLAIEAVTKAVHSSYFTQIYPVLSALLKKIYATENIAYKNHLESLKNITMDDLGINQTYQLFKEKKPSSSNLTISSNNTSSNSPTTSQPFENQHKITTIKGNKRFQAHFTMFNNGKFEQELSVTVYLGVRFGSKHPRKNLLPYKKSKLFLYFEKPVTQSFVLAKGFFFNNVKNSVIWYDNSKMKFCQLEFPSNKIFLEFQQEARSFDKKQDLLQEDHPFIHNTDHSTQSSTPVEDNKLQYVPYKKAIDEFSLLPTFTNSQDKFQCIQRVLGLIAKCIDEYFSEDSVHTDDDDTEPRVLSADDLVPLLSFVVLKSKVEDLPTEINFLQEFFDDQINIQKGELGYSLVSLQTAIDYLGMLSNQKEKK